MKENFFNLNIVRALNKLDLNVDHVDDIIFTNPQKKIL